MLRSILALIFWAIATAASAQPATTKPSLTDMLTANCTATHVLLGGAVSPGCGPTPTRAGDLMYFNGTNWVSLAGNNSGTGTLQETSAGVPSWAALAAGAAGQLPGTATNDNATAGNVGEFVSSSCPAQAATITVTIASPAVVTYTAHGLLNTNGRLDLCPIVFTTSGTLPTGIVPGTRYWTVPSSITTNTFQIATTIANAIAGTSINTTGSQSGTQTGTFAAPVTTGNPFDATAIPLTAGDWDVWGTTITSPAGSTTQTQVFGWTSSTSATTPTVPAGGIYGLQATFNAGAGVYAPVSATRYILSGTGTAFLSGLVSFGTSTDAIYGVIYARRRR